MIEHLLSLHSTAASSVALCAALPLPKGNTAPEWIHLMPPGTVTTVDGRGPYRIADAATLAAASLEAAGGRLVLDENHAANLAAPKGEPAPARGWITGLQARPTGIWGKVDWTRTSTELMADRAYRHISPATLHRDDGQVTAILRASLVNRPNLKGLTALHQEQGMEFLKKLATSLGLPETATESEVLASVAGRQAALQSALDPIAAIVGLQAGSAPAAVLAGVQKLNAGSGDGQTVVALQAGLTSVTNRLNTLAQMLVYLLDIAAQEAADLLAGKRSVTGLPGKKLAKRTKAAKPVIPTKIAKDLPWR